MEVLAWPHETSQKSTNGAVWTQLYGQRLKQRPRPQLKVGDRVRLMDGRSLSR